MKSSISEVKFLKVAINIWCLFSVLPKKACRPTPALVKHVYFLQCIGFCQSDISRALV